MDYEEKAIELASGLKIALQYNEEDDCYTNDIVITDVSGTECVLYIEEVAEIYFALESFGLV